jgi:hypothetical protein
LLAVLLVSAAQVRIPLRFGVVDISHNIVRSQRSHEPVRNFALRSPILRAVRAHNQRGNRQGPRGEQESGEKAQLEFAFHG